MFQNQLSSYYLGIRSSKFIVLLKQVKAVDEIFQIRLVLHSSDKMLDMAKLI